MFKEKDLLEDQMVITDNDGNEMVADILFTHTKDDKNYVVFQIVDTEEISAAVYIPGEDETSGTFDDIKTDAEWDMLDELLESYFDDLDIEESIDEEE